MPVGLPIASALSVSKVKSGSVAATAISHGQGRRNRFAQMGASAKQGR
jgi:hypothetical protein